MRRKRTRPVPANLDVIVRVRGGIAYVERINRFVKVEVWDYDNGRDMLESDPMKHRDENGDAYALG